MFIKKKQVVLLLVSTGLILSCLPYGKVLAIKAQDSTHLIGYIDLMSEDEFQMQYIHSVHRTPVTESYQVNADNAIVQTELAYENFAIGMPSNALGNEEFEMKDGTYYITNMNRVFPYIDIRTGQVIANHTLLIENHRKPLKEFVEPGSWIRFKVEPISFWQRLKGEEVLG